VQPLLLDEGLYPQVAAALTLVEWTAHAVGGDDAPPRESGDDINVAWCRDTGNAVLVTNDRGRRDRQIHNLLAQARVHAIFVNNVLRNGDPHRLLYAILKSEAKMDEVIGHGGLLHHHLRVGGGLDPR
jgi:hypothetical protein